ncbi:hypothetical protein [Ruminococcus flavefaciens]|uniref:hypothetical protein n=1 Tax=Ruminococcus flavefaciens TaxID=1265 RepID=UPI0003019DD2|nr:hypothetical protein [Ruminococcus flavefaciens]
MRLIAYILIAIAFIAIIGVPIEALVEHIRKGSAYRAARKEIEANIRVWESIAKSCDPITDAYDKGYAIARLVIYHHELDELTAQKEYLCS